MTIPQYTCGSGTITFINGNLDRGYDRTDFGVRLTTGFGKLSQFCCMDRDNRMKKICAVALTAIALTALIAAPPALCLYFITVCAFSTIPLALKIGGIALYAIFMLAGSWLSLNLVYQPLRDEYNHRKQEKDVIQALGGKQVFDQLPTAQPNTDTGSMDWLSPTDLQNRPITKGFDIDNRPFVSFCLQNNHENPHVETFYKSNSDSTLWLGGCDRTIFNRGTAFEFYDDFENNLTKIRTLVSGQEVNGYTLVQANAQID